MHMDQKSKQELRSWIFPILMLIFVTPQIGRAHV